MLGAEQILQLRDSIEFILVFGIIMFLLAKPSFSWQFISSGIGSLFWIKQCLMPFVTTSFEVRSLCLLAHFIHCQGSSLKNILL